MKVWRKIVSSGSFKVIHIRKSEMMLLGLEGGNYVYRVIPQPPNKFIVELKPIGVCS